jgi:hypothetical protein
MGLNHRFAIYADAAKYTISPKYKNPLAVTEIGTVQDGWTRNITAQDKENSKLY